MSNRESKYASFWTRLLAHNIDLIPILIILYGASFIIPKAGYDIFIFGGIYLCYYIGFEISPWQATPGKKWVKIKVTNPAGERAKIVRIILRNTCKFLSLTILFGGFVMIIFNGKRQGLHDFIGGTLVLFDED